MVQLDRIEHFIEQPEGVSIEVADNGDVTVTGPNGKLSRNFAHHNVSILQQGNGILIRVDLPRRRDKAMAGTWRAHLNNMVKGVNIGFTYTLKAVYSHFPMTMKVVGSELVVNNYFGEKIPRRAEILSEVEVKVQNKVEVVVSGIDKENVGQTAANIERCCTIKKRDRRIFQDGIYLVGKE